jgi:hypothetical protein
MLIIAENAHKKINKTYKRESIREDVGIAFVY